MAICPQCHGKGEVKRKHVNYEHFVIVAECPHCHGTGEVSCCDGPVGTADEEPTTPQESE